MTFPRLRPPEMRPTELDKPAAVEQYLRWLANRLDVPAHLVERLQLAGRSPRRIESEILRWWIGDARAKPGEVGYDSGLRLKTPRFEVFKRPRKAPRDTHPLRVTAEGRLSEEHGLQTYPGGVVCIGQCSCGWTVSGQRADIDRAYREHKAS